jgi:hypothetical protein
VKHVTILTLPCTICHQSPSKKDTTRPVLRNLGDSALSIRSRPGLDPASTLSTVQQRREDGMARLSGSFRRLVPYVAMVSRDGRPFPGHVATVISTGIDKTSPQGSRRPGLLSPYKRVGRGSTNGRDNTRTQTKKQRTTDHKAEGQALQGPPYRDQHLKQSSLYSFFSLRLGFVTLSRKLVTPTQAPRCKEIQNSHPRWTLGLLLPEPG